MGEAPGREKVVGRDLGRGPLVKGGEIGGMVRGEAMVRVKRIGMTRRGGDRKYGFDGAMSYRTGFPRVMRLLSEGSGKLLR